MISGEGSPDRLGVPRILASELSKEETNGVHMWRDDGWQVGGLFSLI